jgi:hypothetical protein
VSYASGRAPARRVVKQRSALVTAWLLLVLLTNAFWEGSTILASHLVKVLPTNVPVSQSRLTLQALLFAAGIVAAIGLLNWQKWALYVYFAANGLVIVTMLLNREVVLVLMVLVGTGITVALLNSNSPRTVLQQLE